MNSDLDSPHPSGSLLPVKSKSSLSRNMQENKSTCNSKSDKTSTLKKCKDFLDQCLVNGKYAVDSSGCYCALQHGPVGTSWWPTRIQHKGKSWKLIPGMNVLDPRLCPPQYNATEWSESKAEHNTADVLAHLEEFEKMTPAMGQD